MLKHSFLLVLLTFFFVSSYAVDRLVQEVPTPGNYGSISLAVAAANDGDRIIITDRALNLPWIENITITKSLEFRPAVDGTRFKAEGDYRIQMAANGGQVRIVGMDNNTRDILALGAAPAGARTRVEIVGCSVRDINFSEHNYNVILAGNEVNRFVQIEFGGIYGNRIGEEIFLRADSLATNDYVNVIGNSCSGIYNYNDSQYFFISNNNVRSNGSPADNNAIAAIHIFATKGAGSQSNTIVNNSINIFNLYGMSFPHGIYVALSSTGPNSHLHIINNVFVDGYSSNPKGRGIASSSSSAPNLTIDYNLFHSNFAISVLATSGSTVSNTLNSSNLSLSNNGSIGSNLQDLGSPERYYYDLDLTRNDHGCFGGSFSIANFNLSTIPNSVPQVYYMKTPRTILQGNTFDVEAEGWDR